jgi:hypothetical protein
MWQTFSICLPSLSLDDANAKSAIIAKVNCGILHAVAANVRFAIQRPVSTDTARHRQHFRRPGKGRTQSSGDRGCCVAIRKRDSCRALNLDHASDVIDLQALVYYQSAIISYLTPRAPRSYLSRT